MLKGHAAGRRVSQGPEFYAVGPRVLGATGVVVTTEGTPFLPSLSMGRFAEVITVKGRLGPIYFIIWVSSEFSNFKNWPSVCLNAVRALQILAVTEERWTQGLSLIREPQSWENTLVAFLEAELGYPPGSPTLNAVHDESVPISAPWQGNGGTETRGGVRIIRVSA